MGQRSKPSDCDPKDRFGDLNLRFFESERLQPRISNSTRFTTVEVAIVGSKNPMKLAFVPGWLLCRSACHHFQ